MEFKRIEGTTIYIPSRKVVILQNERKKLLLYFLIVMMFLSVFVYMFPMGSIRTNLDNALHMVTYMIPVACGFFLIIFEVRKDRRMLKV